MPADTTRTRQTGRKTAAIAALALAIAGAGCSSGDADEPDTDTPPTSADRSQIRAVIATATAAIRDSDADRLCATLSLDAVRGAIPTGETCADTVGAQIASITEDLDPEIVAIDIDDDHATVTARQRPAATKGPATRTVATFARERDGWKIDEWFRDKPPRSSHSHDDGHGE